MNGPIAPYGGCLVDLRVDEARAKAYVTAARDLPSLDLDRAQMCEVELLTVGAYSPLDRFLDRTDYAQVLAHARLADGTPWPWPVVLALSERQAAEIETGHRYALRDAEGFMPALLEVTDVWPADHAAERAALGEPLPGSVRVGGRVEAVALPPRHDFLHLRSTPASLRELLRRRGWERALAFLAEGVPARPQAEHAHAAALARGAGLMVLGMGGILPDNEAEYFSRVRATAAACARLPVASTLFCLLPLPRLPAGPRGLWLAALVARNYGASGLVWGGQARVGECRRGEEEVRAALALPHLAEAAGVELVPFPRLVYVEDEGRWLPQDRLSPGVRAESFGHEECLRRLDHDLLVPGWYAWPEVLDELRRAHPPRHNQGFCVFFTGLSGAGKSTLARALQMKLLELTGRQVTLLDGDVVRKHLSSELGFSREHRDLNIRRIGYVASEIVKHRGIAICAPIAPYAATRREVRRMIEQYGGFFEIYVSTPIEVCEARDRKGLYAKARAGLVQAFTGVSDPYEAPENPELAIDTSALTVDEAVQRILLELEREGYLR